MSVWLVEEGRGYVEHIALRDPAVSRWAVQQQSAEQRARELLRSHLTPKQRDEFDRTGRFLVAGPKHSWRRPWLYRIHSQRSTYPIEIVRPRLTHRCRLGVWAEPHGLPRCDVLLALKLSLEADDQHILGIACRARR